ncbi:hypothetical protein ACLSU7_05250 [Bdellovibrio sp. HCB185ZH]|uniref:hypothetical protein n=1 Tax=Bdellovibrio sp. HCB185ZH TaxID=3394235 RepID=UPI0039A476B9
MSKSVIALFALFLPLLVHAQVLEEDDQPVIVKKSPYAIVEGSSEHNRMGKVQEIFVTPVAMGPVPGVNAGFGFAKYITRNDAVVVTFSTLTKGSTCSGALTCSDSGFAVEINYRRFITNSFYFGTGLNQRSVHSEGTDEWAGNEFSFDGTTTALGFVIGNQWQWQNFMLGCDWVGVNIPLITNVSNVKNINNGSSIHDYESSKSSLVTNTTAMGLRLHIGYTF